MKMLRAAMIVFGSCVLATTMPAPAYMKLGDIKGEATDADHKDWIIIESMSSPVSMAELRESPTRQTGARDVSSGQASGKRDAATGQATGKRQHKPFVITKTVDKSSPKLAEAAAKGKVFATIEIGEANGTYTLTDAVISGIQPSSGGDRPMESLSLNFTKIEWTAKKGKSDDAALRESPTRASTGKTTKTEKAP